MKRLRRFLSPQRQPSGTRLQHVIGQLPGTWLHLLGGYLGALVLCVLSVAITYGLGHFASPFAYPASPCILGILVIALLWGAGPSVFATLLAAALLDFVFLPPTFFWSLHTIPQAIDTGMFLLIGFIISQVASRLQHARQEALTASRRLHDLFMLAPAGIAIFHGPEHRFDLANPLFLQVADRTSALGKPVREVMLGEEQQAFIHMLDQVYTTGTLFFANEVWMQMQAPPGGTLREGCFNIVCQPFRAPGGTVEGIMVHEMEVTEQVLARRRIEELVSQLRLEKEALKRSERTAATRASELEATIESITDGVVVCDLDGRIQQANAAFRALFSLEMESKDDFSIQGRRSPWHLLRATSGEPLPKAQWPLLRMLHGIPPEGPRTLDLLARTETGRELFLNVSDAPVTDATGRIIGGVAAFRDVTERRQLERRMRQALDALLAMAEVIVEAPLEERALTEEIVGDMRHTASALASLICHVLACERIGIAATPSDDDYLQPLAVAGCEPDEEREWFTEVACLRLEDVLSTRRTAPLSKEGAVLRSLPEKARQTLTVWEHASTLVLPLQAGPRLLGVLLLDYGETRRAQAKEERTLVGAVGRLVALVIERERLWREWAEARANELALQEAARHMDTFLGIAGHELKTPLTVIKGSLQLARWNTQRAVTKQNEDAHAGDDQLEPLPNLLGRAEHQVNRLTRLVNDLIEVSRIHTDALEMHMEPCDLAALVRAAVEEQCVVFPARTIHLEEPSPQGLPVFADADRIGQVMTNFLTNALKYSPSDQLVEVRIERREPHIHVRVRDRGPGLTKEQQGHVWDRFHRVQDIKVQDGSSLGLGLGLFICRMIIEQHHGQVGVESIPGEGSTFWFSLPLLQMSQKKKRR